VIEAGAWLLETGHRALLAVTGGRFPRTVAGMQPVELHTIGRRSGQRRSTLLTAPIDEDGRVVLVASKGGHRDHPQWYRNLVVNPEVELTVNGRTREMRAAVLHLACTGLGAVEAASGAFDHNVASATTAVTFVVTAVAPVGWGYYGDRTNHKPLPALGALLCVVGGKCLPWPSRSSCPVIGIAQPGRHANTGVRLAPCF
jgi:deazaflavin-dependent oxidoreductase (nitroreductase family)